MSCSRQQYFANLKKCKKFAENVRKKNMKKSKGKSCWDYLDEIITEELPFSDLTISGDVIYFWYEKIDNLFLKKRFMERQ